MAAYGALLSLTNTIDQILNHPRPPISLDKQQIQPLIEKAAFLMQFLENYTIDDAEYGLEVRMIDAAHEAEDIIESHIADHIRDEDEEDSLYRYIRKMMLEPDRGEAIISSKDNEPLYREVQKVIHDFDSITKDVDAVKEKAGKKIVLSDDAMLGSDDIMNDIMDKLNGSSSEVNDSVMNDIMDKLTNQQSGRWIIAITGMGGIGKTTLAKRIYEHPLIVEYFGMCRWATVSQEINSKRILLEILHFGSEDKFSQMSEHELGQKLYQSLFGRRYLIVIDDIWGIDAWDRVKHFFPVNNNGSRVLVTTRLSKVALQLDGRDYFQMSLLNQNESWNLLHRCVFQEQGCPPELKEIGKDIAKKCRGLPLSIVLIGGLLAKSEQTRQNWKHILDNLSSTVNLEEDERCFRILKLSYNQLPIHLKPCFLYMAMFPEDHTFNVSVLFHLWVDEGFVKPVAGKSLETTARAVYLNDLVIRNLVMVRGWDSTGRILYCGIHDLLRDLCIKEAEKYNLFRTMETATMQNNPEHHDQISWSAQRRISIHHAASEGENTPRPLPEAVQLASRARTLIWRGKGFLAPVVPFRLLRVLNESFYFGDRRFVGNNFHLVNLRHLHTQVDRVALPEIYRLWNLRTLNVDLLHQDPVMLDIWRMPQLRHVRVDSGLLLTDPPPLPMDEENGWMVLENLQTLKDTINLKLSEEMVERIPNIKYLTLFYGNLDEEEELSLSPGNYGLDNLCRLRKLEIFTCCSWLSGPIEVTSFPITLRKLTLMGTRLGWEEMGTKIGSLPYLEALKLLDDAFVGPEWETAYGGFRSLKYIKISGCNDLEQWKAEAMNFPLLERLDLYNLYKLKEIPLEIWDITTLMEIHVVHCIESIVLSTMKMSQEQQECLGEVGLQIKVWINTEKSQLGEESFKTSPNFTVSTVYDDLVDD